MQTDLFQTDAKPAAAMIMSAVLSGEPEPLYRPELRRVWDNTLPILVVCMLNPSRADHRKNDPTVLALIHFAKLWGYGGILIVNLFDFRSSSPKEMMAHAAPISAENSGYIDGAFIIARHTNKPVLAACLGLTKDGYPKHPMARGAHRIPRDQQPILWKSAQAGE
ncbi:DUF1643 domain-containing protein [Rhizobium sp. SU303]|uniref:DUF1643 domain-containing protein n=1 Tax=Rhizobium sp. SU303 TaxID=3138065 RepID=UPI001E2915D4|nr:DUF1643 domain-containing protein [Rhizobium leguminosarum]UFW79976.1 DUF1643 domain-containing protein [Rhizobium leguminosarum bv. viciae]